MLVHATPREVNAGSAKSTHIHMLSFDGGMLSPEACGVGHDFEGIASRLKAQKKR